MTPAGLILAGGASRRMGRPKALLEYEGETFLGRLQRIFLEHTDPVVIVLGHDAGNLRWLLDPRVKQALNSDPERGMLSSLQAGLRKSARLSASSSFRSTTRRSGPKLLRSCARCRWPMSPCRATRAGVDTRF